MDITTFIAQNPDLPLEAIFLGLLWFLLKGFTKDAESHYARDEQYQKEAIAILREIKGKL